MSDNQTNPQTPAPNPQAQEPQGSPQQPDQPQSPPNIEGLEGDELIAAAIAATEGDEPPAPVEGTGPTAEGTEPTGEAPPVESAPTPDEPLDERWAKVMAADKKLRDERDALKAQRVQIIEMQQRVQQAQQTEQTLAEKLKADPIGALESQGITMQQLVDRVLNTPDEGTTVSNPEVAELKELVKKQQQALENFQNQQVQSSTQAKIAEYKSGLNTEAALVDKYPHMAKYRELTKDLGLPSVEDDMFNYADMYAGQYKEVLTAEQVGSIIEERAKDYLENLSRSETLKKALNVQATQQQATQPPQPTTPAEPNTITNNLAAQPQRANADEVNDGPLDLQKIANDIPDEVLNRTVWDIDK